MKIYLFVQFLLLLFSYFYKDSEAILAIFILAILTSSSLLLIKSKNKLLDTSIQKRPNSYFVLFILFLSLIFAYALEQKIQIRQDNMSAFVFIILIVLGTKLKVKNDL